MFEKVMCSHIDCGGSSLSASSNMIPAKTDPSINNIFYYINKKATQSEMRYPELTDEEIEKLRDVLSTALSTMRGDIRKDKLKVIGKALLSVVLITGGVVASIMLPNPITIGVLGGAATLIAGNKGVFGKAKKIKEKSEERKKNKEEMKNMVVEQHNSKVAKDVQSRIYYQQNNQIPEPSAPKLYPDLSKI